MVGARMPEAEQPCVVVLAEGDHRDLLRAVAELFLFVLADKAPATKVNVAYQLLINVLGNAGPALARGSARLMLARLEADVEDVIAGLAAARQAKAELAALRGEDRP